MRSLQKAALFEEMFGYAIAVTLFLACVKLLQLLKFNPRLALIIETIDRSKRELVAFSVIFACVYTAFCRLKSVVFMLISHSQTLAALSTCCYRRSYSLSATIYW